MNEKHAIVRVSRRSAEDQFSKVGGVLENSIFRELPRLAMLGAGEGKLFFWGESAIAGHAIVKFCFAAITIASVAQNLLSSKAQAEVQSVAFLCLWGSYSQKTRTHALFCSKNWGVRKIGFLNSLGCFRIVLPQDTSKIMCASYLKDYAEASSNKV